MDTYLCVRGKEYLHPYVEEYVSCHNRTTRSSNGYENYGDDIESLPKNRKQVKGNITIAILTKRVTIGQTFDSMIEQLSKG